MVALNPDLYLPENHFQKDRLRACPSAKYPSKDDGEQHDEYNENQQSNDKEVIQKGAALFKTVCTPCHGVNAEGGVGPNLTDEFWLHGGGVKDVFKTIKYGVPEKGMVAWEKSMNAKQISDITNYVLSLKGSNPAGAKAPQGKKD
jgi:cytochrome c oxidase cbb3-type subunit 3